MGKMPLSSNHKLATKVQRINEIQTFYPIILGKYCQRKKGATPLMDVAPNSLRCHVITL